MAVVSGAGPHKAWVTVDGATFPVERGSVEQHKTRKTSTFHAALPLSLPGAEDALAELGDNETTVLVDTRSDRQVLFTGEIDTVDIDYIAGIIRLTGRDKSAKLHEAKSNEKWQNRLGSEIVQELAARAGLSAQADASPVMAGKQLEQDFVRLSDNISLAEVIHKLSQVDGARWWVDQNGTLQYRVGKMNPNGIYTVTYVPPSSVNFKSADCHHLKIRRNVQAGKTVKVTVKSWHPKKKEIFGYESNVEGKGSAIEHRYDIPNLTQDHVRQYARARATESARHEITVYTTVVGDPNINVAMGLQLSGTRHFDQLYEMDTVHHEFGMSGHFTSITARAPKDGRTAS